MGRRPKSDGFFETVAFSATGGVGRLRAIAQPSRFQSRLDRADAGTITGDSSPTSCRRFLEEDVMNNPKVSWGTACLIWCLIAAPAAAQPTLEAPVPAPPPPLTVSPPPSGGAAVVGVGDPFLRTAPPTGCLPGWFAGVEVAALKPCFCNNLQSTVTLPLFNAQDVVRVPSAGLDWTASPRLEFGYRFPDFLGEVVVAYRNLASEGDRLLPNYDPLGDGLLTTRLDMNQGDLDYANRATFLGPAWDWKWKVGVRVAEVYYDSRAEGAVIGQRVTNFFLGAGPHAGMSLYRDLGYGLSAFGRLEGAVLVGNQRQTFEEKVMFLDGEAVGDTTVAKQTQAVPVIDFQIGLGWTPAFADGMRVAFGYQLEQWWYLGQTSTSYGDLSAQGLFLRGEFRY
jgi:hypothetical protein